MIQHLPYLNKVMMRSFKLVFALAGLVFLISSSNAFACHRGFRNLITMQNHAGFERTKFAQTPSTRGSGFGLTTEPTTESTEFTSDAAIGTTVQSVGLSATSTDCNSRIANIEKFFDKSYTQIAEESAQGQGPHLEALASQVGCNAQQTVLLEKAMQQNYHGVFAKDDINHSINEFYTVVNNDEQLAACWPNS